MDTPKIIAICYLAAVNLLTFVLYGIDKRRSRRNRWRIPERRLLLLALVGGSIGALMAMVFFHHKTRHPQFKYGVPLILMLQLALVFALFPRFF